MKSMELLTFTSKRAELGHQEAPLKILPVECIEKSNLEMLCIALKAQLIMSLCSQAAQGNESEICPVKQAAPNPCTTQVPIKLKFGYFMLVEFYPQLIILMENSWHQQHVCE